MASGSCETRTSRTATAPVGGDRRSRRASWPRSCCWPYRNGLSDRRAMEAVRFDLRWKVALDRPVDHPGFDPTSLVKFRARLLLHGKERIGFERSLQLATELGVLGGSVEHILDSTPMLAAAAITDRVTLVRAAVRKLIDTVAALDRGAARRLRQ